MSCTFNVAASIKMRKSVKGTGGNWKRNDLQCGRIHKDAEILKTKYKQQRDLLLQCGRIHKDAEIYVLILGE